MNHAKMFLTAIFLIASQQSFGMFWSMEQIKAYEKSEGAQELRRQHNCDLIQAELEEKATLLKQQEESNKLAQGRTEEKTARDLARNLNARKRRQSHSNNQLAKQQKPTLEQKKHKKEIQNERKQNRKTDSDLTNL